MSKKPNILFVGIDSCLATHMSLYGYKRETTPHIAKYFEKGAVFCNNFSPSVPTTPGYASMFTGLDCFGTDVVALRHVGPMIDSIKTLAEIMGEEGYNTTCVGFKGNAASRGFQNYLEFANWAPDESGRSPKAQNLNAVAIPEMKRLAAEDKPFLLFLRHMDPHSPYLPPIPFQRIWYQGNECDPANKSMEPVYAFRPFADYISSWVPEGCTDKDYVIAQYDGAITYMDSCIQSLFTELADLGIEDNTLVVLCSDHGETLYDHDCYFDHHGIYDNTLRVPLAFRWNGKVPVMRTDVYTQLKDIVPTMMELLGIDTGINFDGRSLVPEMFGTADPAEREPEFYISEATWMRKHGWRTPEWKFFRALEPDLHFKPEVELYNLVTDPEENHNLAPEHPELVAYFDKKVNDHVAKRERETGREAPIYSNASTWNGKGHPYATSQEAYDGLYIGNASMARKLQAGNKDEEKDDKK